MMVTRRLFMKQGAIALASVGAGAMVGPRFLTEAVFAESPVRSAQASGGKKVLVCIFQRGAVDGMSMIVPHGDPDYYILRSVAGGIAIPQTGENAVIDLDGRFGLHPALAPLKPIYDAGHLAVLHACGSPSNSRSHFDAQDFMETAAPDDKSISTGWMARTAACCPEDSARMKSLFRDVAMTSATPRSFEGDASALTIPDLRTFGIRDRVRWRRGETFSTVAAMEALYDDGAGDAVHGVGRDAFAAMKLAQRLSAVPYTPAAGATYPPGKLGQSLQQIARLIKENVGLELAFTDVGGWDTHVSQGGAEGNLANHLRDLGKALAAFYTDLGDNAGDVVLLTMSEFGRTAHQNGNAGTDHGHGTCFLAMGGPVNGGKVLGQWPGLAPEQLYQHRDLAVTTDFRDVFAEVANRHLGVQNLPAVFPNFAPSADRFRGVIRT